VSWNALGLVTGGYTEIRASGSQRVVAVVFLWCAFPFCLRTSSPVENDNRTAVDFAAAQGEP
jgi:hypothetical protein